MSGSRALPFHNRMTLFQTARLCVSQRVFVPARVKTQGHSFHTATHWKSAHTWKKNTNDENKYSKKLCFLTGAGLQMNLFWPRVHDLSLPFTFVLTPWRRWCHVYEWISQWIYYRSLSGPVCQACDHQAAVLMGRMRICYLACELL